LLVMAMNLSRIEAGVSTRHPSPKRQARLRRASSHNRRSERTPKQWPQSKHLRETTYAPCAHQAPRGPRPWAAKPTAGLTLAQSGDKRGDNLAIELTQRSSGSHQSGGFWTHDGDASSLYVDNHAVRRTFAPGRAASPRPRAGSSPSLYHPWQRSSWHPKSLESDARIDTRASVSRVLTSAGRPCSSGSASRVRQRIGSVFLSPREQPGRAIE
jgi:hypothetical protein